MKNFISYLIFMFLFTSISPSCSQEPKNLTEFQENEYEEYKKDFKKEFIDQFPENINSPISNIASHTDSKHNNIGFFLYQYKVNKQEIEKIKIELNSEFIKHYNIKDSCLLVVNRFDYLDSNDLVKTKKIDSSLIDRDCYLDKYPIPNFLEYESSEGQPMKLSENYTIYVLEAKPGEYDDNYKMKPNKQMPKEWEHGYSKGIALNEKDREVIYWSVMW